MLSLLMMYIKCMLGNQEVKDFNVHIIANKIKILAAEHQVGRDIVEVRELVDHLIQTIRDNMFHDYDIQMTNWTNLLVELNAYKAIKVDPRWFAVITHAKKRVRSRINNASKQKRRIIAYATR